MTYRPHGKHVVINIDSPDALGICDYSGFVFNRKDLIKQMEWRGNALVWTGFYVGKPYVDTPNEQLRPPILPPDPVPTKDPRLPQGSTQTFSFNTLPVFSQILTPFNIIGNSEDGVPAPTESIRLSNLQQNIGPYLLANGGPMNLEQPLNPNVALSNLQNFYWGQ